MLAKIASKQSRAVSVVKTALANVGIKNRSVCVTVFNWGHGHGGARVNVCVFVAADKGANTEPFFETGETIAGAVRNIRLLLKGKTAQPNRVEAAPF
jgi:hypothetical protein